MTLVEREDELSRLVRDARSAQGRILLVQGPAGAGKTELGQHMLHHAVGSQQKRALAFGERKLQ